MTGSTPKVDVVVVGGGIAGLASAFALTQKGLKVRLLERHAEFGEVGAGLQIGPNCNRILDQWGLLDEVISLGVVPDNLIARDGITGEELTRLDLADVRKRYGFPYLVIHRSDLHAVLLRACQRAGVDLVNNAQVTGYENIDGGARAFGDGWSESAEIVVAADGIHSVARPMIVQDEPQNSSYVAYRAAIPAELTKELNVSMNDVVVYMGPKNHMVQYPLRSGEMFNLVAVFQSKKALAGEPDWGTPDEMDAAFAENHENVRSALNYMWRDRWWRMFDRKPILNWVNGRIALQGDAAHPPLQYLAQGAIMAIEDAWVLSEWVERVGVSGGAATGTPTGVDWDEVLARYNAVRPPHCKRILETGHPWGELWHVVGEKREWRNAILKSRDIHDYSYTDWLYTRTAMTPEEEMPMFPQWTGSWPAK